MTALFPALFPGVRRIRPDDHFMILTDTDATPMHIGALQYYDAGAGDRESFFDRIVEHVDARLDRTPLLSVLHANPDGFDADVWVDVGAYDRAYHFVRVAEPLDEPALRARVASLAMERLDLSRPPFRMHVFDNLADGAAALYLRVHHGVADGIGFQSIVRLLSDERPPAERTRRDAVLPDAAAWRAASEAWFAGNEAMIRDRRASMSAAAKRLRSGELPPRAETPLLRLSGPTSTRRSYQTLSVALERVRAIGRRLGGTVNDVFLAVSATAVRDVLIAIGDLPAAPLVANSARSYRRPEHGEFGNRITGVHPQLGTHIADPLARLRAIQASMAEELARSRIEEELFDSPEKPWGCRDRHATIAARAASGAAVLPGNISLSNVPGPANALAMAGHAQRANFPVPLLGNNRFLNITSRRNAERLDIGIMADPTKIPDVDAVRRALIGAIELHERLTP